MDKNYIVAASRPWYAGITERLSKKHPGSFFLATTPDELLQLDLAALSPQYIFVPHWSWIIPESVWKNYDTVIFHMTDLPFGRGGSPLQNLIDQGVKNTMISALKCEKALDAGAIYLKAPLSLEGTAEEIFSRSVPIIEEMILQICTLSPKPVEQIGEPVYFQRRKPENSNLIAVNSLEKAYDYIRMLDAPGYPPAFIEHGAFRIEFSQATLNDNQLTANVTVTLKDEWHDL